MKRKQLKLCIFFLAISLFLTTFSVNAFAETSQVPDWMKNNAKWWAEGKITEQEYLNSILFLIDKGIIKVKDSKQLPSDQTSLAGIATKFGPAELPSNIQITPFSKNIVPESDRAKGFIVRISGGELDEIQTFQTFGRFEPGEDPTFLNSLKSQGLSSYFLLESLPSKDKVKLYEIISRYFNPGKTPEPIDVSIDGLAGDGSTIVTANYEKCKISDYLPYLQNHVFVYQLNKKFEPEIRDHTIFSCQGFNVEVNPENEKVDLSSLNSVPNVDDRAKKFVVHFFSGELNQIYSTTFAKFAPSVDTVDTPFVTITTSGNPIGSAPQFFLESLPSYDKKEFYEFLSRYVNPVKKPELFNVSIDLITGDNTILQRWNYVDCEVTNYQMRLDDSFLNYPFSDKLQAEISDKTDFSCLGNELLVDGVHQLDKLPIKDKKFQNTKSEEFDLLYTKDFPSENDRAMSYNIHTSGGELKYTYTNDEIPIFAGLVQNRGPLTPLHHAKQYDVGFYIEALPSKDKEDFYNFLAQYVNPGKQPEPIDVDVEVITGDGRILETLQYRSCTAIDFNWYSQQFTFLYQITNQLQEEIRERFTFYCDGYTINAD
ncbi:MAG TPA: hypothetical protein ENH95_04015 [Nitrosopumilus sp.]|nr:hypothetical protein [Nitrosopumilus sp.]